MLFIGVGMAIAGNILIACSLTLQKHVHVKMAHAGRVASQSPLFWVALGGMIVGEVGNFAAFGFASPTVVSPLGAVAVITNAVLAVVVRIISSLEVETRGHLRCGSDRLRLESRFRSAHSFCARPSSSGR